MQSESQEAHATHFPKSQKPQKSVIANRAGMALDREGSQRAPTCRTGHDGCPWRATAARRTLWKQSWGQMCKHEHCPPFHVFKHLPQLPNPKPSPVPPPMAVTPPRPHELLMKGQTAGAGEEDSPRMYQAMKKSMGSVGTRGTGSAMGWIPSGHSQDPLCPLSMARMGVPAA